LNKLKQYRGGTEVSLYPKLRKMTNATYEMHFRQEKKRTKKT